MLISGVHFSLIIKSTILELKWIFLVIPNQESANFFYKRTDSNYFSLCALSKNYMHAKQLPVASRPSVFQSPDEDDEEDYEQWLEIKGKVPGLLPTVHSCSSSSAGRLHGPGESAAGCGLLGVWSGHCHQASRLSQGSE